jgi:hypothetical protein
MKERAVSTSNVEERVKVLAAVADLPLEDHRISAISQILGRWLTAANVLSAKMSAPGLAQVTPITGILQTVNHGEVSHGE